MRFCVSIHRSPTQARFRIPPTGYRNLNAKANVFSQYVAPDVSTFMAVCRFLLLYHRIVFWKLELNFSLQDSFVVTDEEMVDDEEESEMSELERAEMILKEQQRQKRKLKQNGQVEDGGVKKRRRIMLIDSDSD